MSSSTKTPWFELKDVGGRSYSPANPRRANITLSELVKPATSSAWNCPPSYPPSHRHTAPFTMPSINPHLSDHTSDQLDFRARHAQLKSLDDQKNQLIEDIIDRYDHLNEMYKLVSEDNIRANELVSFCQRREKTFQENIRQLKSLLDSDPFVLVLLDGNSFVFDEKFLHRGERGGRDAASQLHAEIWHHISRTLPELPPETKIVVRVCANVQKLAQRTARNHFGCENSTAEDFVRGFNSADSLFDFVDVGGREEIVHKRLCDVLKLHLYDYHCRQIILGLNSKPLAVALDEVAGDETTKTRLTILDHPLCEEQLLDASFERCCFSGLFQKPILSWTSDDYGMSLLPTNPTTYTTPPTSRPISRTDTADVQEPTSELPAAKVASVDDTSKPSPVASWASAVKNSAPLSTLTHSLMSANSVTVTPADSRSSTPTAVPRNRRGQRVDPVIKHDRDEVDRVKRKKWCNVHFLRQECAFGDSCTHVHNPKPSAQELQTLRLVARMAPCKDGSDCDDVKCIYGHICPAPEGRKGELCIFGENCRFPKDLHGVDRAVVKIVKV